MYLQTTYLNLKRILFGIKIVKCLKMKILTLSVDTELIRLIDTYASDHKHQSIKFNTSKRPIDIVGYVYEQNPFLIIVDDDFVKPDAAVTISTIKKMKEKVKVIFSTWCRSGRSRARRSPPARPRVRPWCRPVGSRA